MPGPSGPPGLVPERSDAYEQVTRRSQIIEGSTAPAEQWAAWSFDHIDTRVIQRAQQLTGEDAAALRSQLSMPSPTRRTSRRATELRKRGPIGTATC